MPLPRQMDLGKCDKFEGNWNLGKLDIFCVLIIERNLLFSHLIFNQVFDKYIT